MQHGRDAESRHLESESRVTLTHVVEEGDPDMGCRGNGRGCGYPSGARTTISFPSLTSRFPSPPSSTRLSLML
jgi:hypothetical protein